MYISDYKQTIVTRLEMNKNIVDFRRQINSSTHQYAAYVSIYIA